MLISSESRTSPIRTSALIAWPARYGETGVMTFVVNQAGAVYEHDFGTDTDGIAPKIMTFNPGAILLVGDLR